MMAHLRKWRRLGRNEQHKRLRRAAVVLAAAVSAGWEEPRAELAVRGAERGNVRRERGRLWRRRGDGEFSSFTGGSCGYVLFILQRPLFFNAPSSIFSALCSGSWLLDG